MIDTRIVLLAKSFTTWQRILKDELNVIVVIFSIVYFFEYISYYKFFKLFQCVCDTCTCSFLFLVLLIYLNYIFSIHWAISFFLSFIPCEDFEISESTPQMWTTVSISLTTSQGSFTSEADANLNVTDGYSNTMAPTTFKMQFSESGLDFISSMYWKYKTTFCINSMSIKVQYID